MYRCPEHAEQVFIGSATYEEHLKLEHSYSSAISDALVQHASGSTMHAPGRLCPVCSFSAPTAKTLQSHMALHLERFSLFSLPRGVTEDDDNPGEAASDKVNAMAQDSRAEDSEQELIFDDNQSMEDDELFSSKEAFASEALPFFEGLILTPMGSGNDGKSSWIKAHRKRMTKTQFELRELVRVEATKEKKTVQDIINGRDVAGIKRSHIDRIVAEYNLAACNPTHEWRPCSVKLTTRPLQGIFSTSMRPRVETTKMQLILEKVPRKGGRDQYDIGETGTVGDNSGRPSKVPPPIERSLSGGEPDWVAPDKMKMKKRVLHVYDGERRLTKDKMMLDDEFQVRTRSGDSTSYIINPDVRDIEFTEDPTMMDKDVRQSSLEEKVPLTKHPTAQTRLRPVEGAETAENAKTAAEREEKRKSVGSDGNDEASHSSGEESEYISDSRTGLH